jgi:acyl carrier protein
MEINQFIKHIAEQYDDTDPSVFNEGTLFKELEEYSSLTALNIISVIDDEYDVYLKGEDIRNSSTIKDLFEKVAEKVG